MEVPMKKTVSLGFAFVLVALAASLTVPAAAVPEDPPDDNVCICHNTQHHKNNEGEANENQKTVIICVDPNSNVIPAHEKHGDAIVDDIEGCPVPD
jgi:hypothetical protein